MLGWFAVLLYYLLSLSAALEAYLWIKRNSRKRRQRGSRDAYFAVFLSWLFPGIGHIYGKRYVQGCFLLIAYVSYLFFPLFQDDLLPNFVVNCLVAVVAYALFKSIEGDRMKLKQGLKVILFLFGVSLLTNSMGSYLKRTILFGGRSIGRSMVPAIQEQDIVLWETYTNASPRRGDIVVLDGMGIYEQNLVMKRLIGFEGENIETKNGSVYVNGERLDYPPFSSISYSLDSLSNIFEKSDHYQVPRNSIFVLGDNPEESLDSRHIGAIPLDRLKGRVYKIIWPLKRAQRLLFGR